MSEVETKVMDRAAWEALKLTPGMRFRVVRPGCRMWGTVIEESRPGFSIETRKTVNLTVGDIVSFGGEAWCRGSDPAPYYYWCIESKAECLRMELEVDGRSIQFRPPFGVFELA